MDLIFFLVSGGCSCTNNFNAFFFFCDNHMDFFLLTKRESIITFFLLCFLTHEHLM